MQKALSWLDDRLRQALIITDEEERESSVWYHLAAVSSGITSAESVMPPGNTANGSDWFDDLDMLGADWDSDISESLQKVEIPSSGQTPGMEVPLFFRNEQGSDLNESTFSGALRIMEWQGEGGGFSKGAAFLSRLLSTSWKACFPVGFDFEHWLFQFTGTLKVGYCRNHALSYSADGTDYLQLSQSTMPSFAQLRSGQVRLGIPEPGLMIVPLMMEVWSSQKHDDVHSQRPHVFLIGDNLSLPEMKLIPPLHPSILIAVGRWDEQYRQPIEISIGKLFNLVDLDFRLLILCLDEFNKPKVVKAAVSQREVAAGTDEHLCRLPPAWRIQLASWLNDEHRSWDRFGSIFSRSIEVMCNEWWVARQPTDSVSVRVLLSIGQFLQERVLIELSSLISEFIDRHPDFRECSAEVKRRLFASAEGYFLPITSYLQRT